MVGTKFLNRVINLYTKTEFTKKLFIRARTARAVSSDRTVEYAWVLTQLGKNDKKILDVGSTNSVFPIQLASIGYDVYSIDPRNYLEWNGLVHPNMKFIKGDITKAPFTSGFFDVVTAISTIEHIGTEDYFRLPQTSETEDLKAIQEIARILKAHGKFIFTLPYRSKMPSKIIKKRKIPFVRLYNEKTIRNRLLQGYFEIEYEQYFRRRNGFWFDTPTKEMTDLSEENGLACIVARKV